jgi:DNA-binding NtrC family response regulator
MAATAPDDGELLHRSLFPYGDADAVARLIRAHQDKEARIVEEWYGRCASSFGAHRALSRRTFEEIYVPSLRRAYAHLINQDAAAFAAFGRKLGQKLAVAHVPFPAYVAYLHFLRQSYAVVLAGEGGDIGAALELVDTIHSRLVAITADGYYAAPGEPSPARSEANAEGAGDAARAFHGMVGRSAAMQRVFHRVDRIAGQTTPVLILGETGTGKELVARAIHQAGPRSAGPFIAVNCAALPRELIESELFGYRRGAFSGAVTECIGLFRAAAGGTLLLDEITEMAPDLQAKLLRVLQDRAIRPVGAVQEVAVDVRIIACTNRDPDGAIGAGVLRADLYYRLSSSTVHLPPLRERREDVPALVARCLQSLEGGPEGGGKQVRVTPEALALLAAQRWPGNVRELFNVVEDAWAMRRGDRIGAEDLSLPGGASTVAPPPPDAPRTLDAAERELIQRVLSAVGGNKVHAARQLGISRTKLYGKLARHGLLDAMRRR